jgi:hypothetical protein
VRRHGRGRRESPSGSRTARRFGLAFRSKVGNDSTARTTATSCISIYGALAAPSEKAYATINDSPEAIGFSWEVTTTPVEVDRPQADGAPDRRLDQGRPRQPRSHLEDILYGTEGVDPRLPLPAEVLGLFAGTSTSVRLTGANAPTYNGTTHVVTIPPSPASRGRSTARTHARAPSPRSSVGDVGGGHGAEAQSGYTITGDDDWTFDY